MIDKDILGKKGKCADCGKDGIYRYEPYFLEVDGERYLICLCEDCDDKRYEDV